MMLVTLYSGPGRGPVISVIIPTLNAAAGLPATLGALVPAAVDGLVAEVIVSDGGSSDATRAIADAFGATIVTGEAGRGGQLRAGAALARSPWLLFLHADTVLSSGWHGEVTTFIGHDPNSARSRAAAFRFALDDQGMAPRLLEWGVRLRSGILKLPYGDQGLLISRALYDEIGGYAPLPLMEDIDIVRRLGWHRVIMLRCEAVTSAERFRRRGYVRQVARNLTCLALYRLGASSETLTRIYRS